MTLSSGPHSEVIDLDAEAKPEAPALNAVDTLPPPIVEKPPPYKPIAIGTAIGAVVLLGAGAGMVGWMNASANDYNDSGCMHLPTPAGCSEKKSQYGTAFDLMLPAFVIGGILAVTSTTLFVLAFQPSKKEGNRTSFWCAPGVGLTCGGRW